MANDFTNCDTQENAVARNVVATFCSTSLGIVRSAVGNSGVELVDITGITDTRRNNAASFDIADATVEIFGLEANLPERGMRGELSITGGAVSFVEYMIVENISVSASVGEAVIYTVTFKTAVDMTKSGT